MKGINSNFELPESFGEVGITKDNVLIKDGFLVKNFTKLRKLIAELSCLNPENILFFRGQHTDFKREYGKKGEASTFLPSLYRGDLKKGDLLDKWNKLELATNLLLEKLKSLPESNKKEFNFLKEKRLAQWSVLQHYEVVDTPLLDVTQSLKVACSFADFKRPFNHAYIYVFALPYPTGRISINSEHYITNIRLLSVVPSCVLRPHNQEGFLIGEDDIIKSDKIFNRYDFRRRAIAKFKIDLSENSNFWEDNGIKDRPLDEKELYPDKGNNNDPLSIICRDIKNSLDHYASDLTSRNDRTDLFLFKWREIERELLGFQREMWHDRKPTVPKALITLKKYSKNNHNEKLGQIIPIIYNLRDMRNLLVHSGPEKINKIEMLHNASWILETLEKEVPAIKQMADFWQKESQELN